MTDGRDLVPVVGTELDLLDASVADYVLSAISDNTKRAFSPAIADRSYDNLMSQYLTDGRFEPKAVGKLVSFFVDLKLVDDPATTSKFYTEEFLPSS